MDYGGCRFTAEGRALSPCHPHKSGNPGLQTKHGRVVAADEIGPDRRSLKPAKAPKDKKEKKKNEPVHAGASDAIAEHG